MSAAPQDGRAVARAVLGALLAGRGADAACLDPFDLWLEASDAPMSHLDLPLPLALRPADAAPAEATFIFPSRCSHVMSFFRELLRTRIHTGQAEFYRRVVLPSLAGDADGHPLALADVLELLSASARAQCTIRLQLNWCVYSLKEALESSRTSPDPAEYLDGLFRLALEPSAPEWLYSPIAAASWVERTVTQLAALGQLLPSNRPYLFQRLLQPTFLLSADASQTDSPLQLPLSRALLLGVLGLEILFPRESIGLWSDQTVVEAFVYIDTYVDLFVSRILDLTFATFTELARLDEMQTLLRLKVVDFCFYHLYHILSPLHESINVSLDANLQRALEFVRDNIAAFPAPPILNHASLENHLTLTIRFIQSEFPFEKLFLFAEIYRSIRDHFSESTSDIISVLVQTLISLQSDYTAHLYSQFAYMKSAVHLTRRRGMLHSDFPYLLAIFSITLENIEAFARS